jgi:hypothetical protein
MTEQEWLEWTDHKPMLALLQGIDQFEEAVDGNDPRPMLTTLPSAFSERRLRLFAVACCRRSWKLLTDERSQAAVEVAERFVDGKATLKELEEAGKAAGEAYGLHRPPHYHHEYVALCAAQCTMNDLYLSRYEFNHQITDNLCWLTDPGTWDVALTEQTVLFRDIFGNPFRPVTVDPSWLTQPVVSLANVIYDERVFDRMPELADALEEAGCTNAEILAHCRGPGPHVRGCWVVDLLLGKK